MKNHIKSLELDELEINNFVKKSAIRIKLAYYFLQRFVADFLLRRLLKKDGKFDRNLFIDKFLLDEGGMFKDYVYRLCDKFKPLKGANILVPGVGYGKNLFQLAAMKPKLIIGFDLYKYNQEWDFLSKKIKEKFNVDLIFINGDFNAIHEKYRNFFDYVISEAVLEHVKDLPVFLDGTKKFLKKDGHFYASFGPIWYGPGGDHIDWGEDQIFDHLLLGDQEYNSRFNQKFMKIENDSCEGAFLVKEKLFSYLSCRDYLDIFKKHDFDVLSLFAKISKKAMILLKKKPDIAAALDKIGAPEFDRICNGFYLWARNKL